MIKDIYKAIEKHVDDVYMDDEVVDVTMFKQTFPNTAGLFDFPNTAGLFDNAGVFSGQSFEDFVIIVVKTTGGYLVMQEEKCVYFVDNTSPGKDKFLEDFKKHSLKPVGEALKEY